MSPLSPDEPVDPMSEPEAAQTAATVIGLSASTLPPPGWRARVRPQRLAGWQPSAPHQPTLQCTVEGDVELAADGLASVAPFAA